MTRWNAMPHPGMRGALVAVALVLTAIGAVGPAAGVSVTRGQVVSAPSAGNTSGPEDWNQTGYSVVPLPR